MNTVRDRAKEYFPTVLLTLLSIVQALALELLWDHLHHANYLFELSWTATVSWLQIIATFQGLILIWVLYANNVMRFRWVPVTSDSVYPFIIGILQFTLVETLRPDRVGLWFLVMAVIFAIMTWVAHANMRRARHDHSNEAFFSQYERAKLRDFYPHISIVCALLLTGAYLWKGGDNDSLALIALLATNAVLAWQFYNSAYFWKRTMTAVADK